MKQPSHSEIPTRNKNTIFSDITQQVHWWSDSHLQKLRVLSRHFMNTQIDWTKENEAEHFHQKKKMFNMVIWLTRITYCTALVMILSQIADFYCMPSDVGPFACGVSFVYLDNQRLLIILSGFLAELLLLPRIILTSLYSDVRSNSSKEYRDSLFTKTSKRPVQDWSGK